MRCCCACVFNAFVWFACDLVCDVVWYVRCCLCYCVCLGLLFLLYVDACIVWDVLCDAVWCVIVCCCLCALVCFV